MDEFVPVLVMLATVKKLVDFVRYAKASDWNGVVTQLVVWVGGVAVVALAAHTEWAGGIEFGGVTLAGMGWASLILVGIFVGSAASTGQDALKAVDGRQSESKPTLIK